MGKWMSVTARRAVCRQQTWDNALNVDGWGDEIYLRWNVQEYDANGPVGDIPASNSETLVYGDINGFPARVRAGSCTPHGGIRGGDTVDFNQLLWAGFLPDDRSIVLRPSVWEWDGPEDMLNSYLDWIKAHAGDLSKIARDAFGVAGNVAAAAIVDLAAKEVPLFTTVLQSFLGVARDRPVGVGNDGAFHDQALVLTQSTFDWLRSQDSGNGPGVVSLQFEDGSALGSGRYDLELVVSGLRDGELIKSADHPEVYVVFGGARFWVPDPALIASYGGWGSLVTVGAGAATTIPELPMDGTMLRELNDPAVYLMDAGHRRHVLNGDAVAHHGGWAMVRVIPNGALAANNIPLGPDIDR